MYKIFEQLVEEYNYKMSEVCQATGLTQTALNYWRSGGSVKKEVLHSIAKYFKVSVEYLMGQTTERNRFREIRINADETINLAEDELDFILNYYRPAKEDVRKACRCLIGATLKDT